MSVSEVVEYAHRTGVLERISGWLKYQLSEKEARYEVRCTDSSQLGEWGESLTKRSAKGYKEQQRIRVLRTLNRLGAVRLAGMETVVRVTPPIPETLTAFCIEKHGRNHLLLENFAALLKSAAEGGNSKLEKAVFFSDENVYVFWLSLAAQKGKKREELRIAISSKGHFVIEGPDTGPIRGFLSTDIKWTNMNVSGHVLMDYFQKNIWGQMQSWNLATIEINSEVDNDRFILSDGRVKIRIPDKPVICKQDPMTGRWRILPKVVETFVSTLTGRDPYRITEYATLIKEKPRYGVDIPCPLPWHRNTQSEAAHWYVEGDRHYIHCFRCHTTIDVASGTIEGNFKPLAVGYAPEDYRFVSRERNSDFDSIVTLGQALSEGFSQGRDYLTQVRGIDPDNDLGRWGYIPPEISKELATLVDEETGVLGVLKGKRSRGERLDFLKDSDLLHPEARDSIYRMLTLLDTLNDSQKVRVLNLITINNLRKWQSRGIVGAWEKDGITVENLGGRFMLPTYWFTEKQDVLELGIANFMGRGIELEGVPLYQGRKQHKAPLRKTTSETDQFKLRPTPTGVWFRDPNIFLEKVLLNKSEEAVLFEGSLNTVTFQRFRPDLAGICMTVLGTGYREPIAMLRYLGVHNDPSLSPYTRSGKLRRIFIGSDFDEGGSEGFEITSRQIKKEFPDLEIAHAKELLPEDIRWLLPEIDPALYAVGDAEAGTTDGPLVGFKLDLNDLIAVHPDGWAEQNKIPPGLASEIEKIRERYAYKPS